MEREKKIIRIAQDFRNNCILDEYGIADIFESLERNGYQTIRYPLESDNVLGLATVRSSTNVIFTNSSQILARENFTAAHELGHHLLSHLEKIKLIKDGNDELKNFSDGIEREANIFATNLLVPEDVLREYITNVITQKSPDQLDCLDVAKMQVAFGVSFEMLLIRLTEIGYLSSIQKKQLNESKMAIASSEMLKVICGYDQLCKATKIKCIPAQFINWVIENYKMKLIPLATLEKAFRYFDADVTKFLALNDLSDVIEDEPSIDELLGG